MKIQSLKLEAISFAHEGQDPILLNADFEFPLGEIVWVKADEGSGKSSLLQILAGLQTPQSGKYILNDQDVLDMSFEEFLPYRLEIGYSFDYGGLLNNKNIFDNLTLPLLYHKLCTSDEATARVHYLLDRFDIKKFGTERPAHIPGRVRKLACLLRALVTKPQILLLDDPSVGIGLEGSRLIADYIHELREQEFLQHIVISSYDESFLNLFEHKVVYLEGGQLFLQMASVEKKVVNL
jgi:ABC-type lipoprotein export system ATPase subunit